MPLFRAWSRGLSRTIEPCLPSPVKSPPAGPDWIHEIKHDGFRIMARRDGRKVRLISRNGHDLTYRFPLAAAAVSALPVRSCLIDGEAIACNDDGLAVFKLTIAFNRHFDVEGAIVYDSIKVKNPTAPAVKPEAEEDRGC
jgi:ATP-dependent DNA ligase